MNNKSFTLIELLVVIVIIGILAGVIMISTSSSISKANIAKLKVFEESVANDLAANMISRWKLDEESGTTTADVWGNNIGNLINSPTWKKENECVSGNCLGFNGSSAYVSCGDLSSYIGKNDVTYSIWVKPSVNGVDGSYVYSFSAFMGKGAGGYSGDLHVGYRSNNKVRVYYENLTTGEHFIDSISSMTLNEWYYIVVSANSSKVSLYINGAFSVSGNIATNFVINNMQIGYSPYAAYFNGLIDDVRIYNGTLSSSQIKQNYIAGLNSMLSNGTISKEEYNGRVNALAYEK